MYHQASKHTDMDASSDDLPLLDEVIIPGSVLETLAETQGNETLEPMIALSQLESLVNGLGPLFQDELEDRMNQALNEEMTRILTGAMEQLRQRLRERVRAEIKLGIDDLLQGLLADARQP